MTCTLAHRGPDAQGIFFDAAAGIGLGHRRLSIIDLSEAANQPFISYDGRYRIAFNGEVYNFGEVKAELQKARPDIPYHTTSDTEVVLNSFIAWGADAVQKWNGMFALAIWDSVEEKLTLFRDRVGKKPLFYFWDGQNFAFASELKGLKNLPIIPKDIDYDAIQHFLHLGYVPEPHTIYKKVKKMKAGAMMTVTKNELKQTVYWDIRSKITTNVLSEPVEAKAQLSALLTDSVSHRMISDVPLGTFLSGGVDSSLVTAIAQSVSKTRVKTFSLGFKEKKFNESTYAQQVADHLHTDHHTLVVSEKDAIDNMEQFLDVFDEPFSDSSAFPTMLVSKLAREHVTVALTGDGGDELFHGYGMYTWAERMNKPMLWNFRKPIGAAMKAGPNRYKRAADLFKAGTKEKLPAHIFSQEQYLFSEKELSGVLTKPLPYENLTFAEAGLRSLTPTEKQAFFDFNYYLKDDLLVKVDRSSMRYSLETRCPLLDYRLVEFAANLAPALKTNNGTQKYLLKEVLYDYLPKEIFDRPKWGFAIPLIQWLQHDLHYLIDDYLNEGVINKQGVVNYATVASLKARFEKGEHYLYNRLWVLILLHKWLENERR